MSNEKQSNELEEIIQKATSTAVTILATDEEQKGVLMEIRERSGTAYLLFGDQNSYVTSNTYMRDVVESGNSGCNIKSMNATITKDAKSNPLATIHRTLTYWIRDVSFDKRENIKLVLTKETSTPYKDSIPPADYAMRDLDLSLEENHITFGTYQDIPEAMQDFMQQSEMTQHYLMRQLGIGNVTYYRILHNERPKTGREKMYATRIEQKVKNGLTQIFNLTPEEEAKLKLLPM